MGAGQSKADTEEKVFYNETPIQFSQDIVNHLSSASTSSSPEQAQHHQSTLDAHVRSRIRAEMENLRAEEDVVRREIERALEKENVDREMNVSSDGVSPSRGVGGGGGGEESVAGGGEGGDVKNSTSLMGDLEELRGKVHEFQAKRQKLGDFSAVKESGEAVVSCYNQNSTTPLNCWRQVSEFKATVAQAELSSLRMQQTL